MTYTTKILTQQAITNR